MGRLALHTLALLAVTFGTGCSDGGTTDVDTDTDTQDTDTVDTDTVVDTVDTDDTDDTDDSDTLIPVDPCLVSPTVVEVGTGDSDFEALTPGQALEMFNGPQGGWHHWVGVRVQNAVEFVQLEVVITDVASGLVVTEGDPITGRVQLVADTLGSWTCSGRYWGFEARLDFSAVGVDANDWSGLCGKEIDMTVRVKTPDGDLLGSDTKRVVSQPDPDNGPYCVAL